MKDLALANKIVSFIANDISGRKGIGDEFEQIDEEIKKEILESWIENTIKILKNYENAY